jgi:capsid protein
MVAWSTTDTREELSGWERGELRRRIHWLKAHFGFARGLINNSADLIGWQSPQAQSGDPEWDEMAEDYFRDRCGHAGAFDVAGKFDYEDAQPMLMRAAFTDAHVFTVLTKWEDGSARFAFYEAFQLRNPEKAGKEWRDGIKVSRTRRHLAYGFWDSIAEKVVVIPASSVIYFGEFDSPGQDAPVPPLAHAVNHSLDIMEIWGFQKKTVKISSLTGAVIERDLAAAPSVGRQGIPGARQTITTATGQKFEQANVWDGGQIASLAPGDKMRILADNRPAAEQRQLLLDLKRDVSYGFGLPLEVSDAISELTGPGIRFVMDAAGNWINCRRKAHKVWMAAIWRYTIGCGIANGALPLPKGDKAKWWAVNFTGKRLLTIDRGKESRARLDELAAGVGTEAGWEEMDGLNWRDRQKQRVTEIRNRFAECGILDPTPEQIYAASYPPRAGTAPPPETEDSKASKEPTTKDKKESSNS